MDPLKFSAAWLLCLFSAVLARGSGGESRFEFSVEMAVPVRMVLYASSEEAAKTASGSGVCANSRVERDHERLRSGQRGAASFGFVGSGQEFPVSADLWNVLSRANEMSIASGGASTSRSARWSAFGGSARQGELPSPERIQQQLASVGFKSMELRQPGRRVLLTRPGMWIDLGGIAKGYAIDEALKVLRAPSLQRRVG